MSLGIRVEINDYLKKSGITEPTPIQRQSIPVLMAGKDIVAQSQTGTGKTLAFLLPIVERIKVNAPHVQALIITPTRELAAQITTVAKALTKNLNINVLAVYGGQPLDQQIRKLNGNPHIVIGTPGRLMDHFRRKTILISGVTKLVLDEADQMLHMGFLDDVEALISETSIKRQTMLFSATMPEKIKALAARYMDKPVDIKIQSPNVTLDEIKQMIIELKEEEKLDKLCSMIDEYTPYLAIVFCHTKRRASMLNNALLRRGYESDELHGDLSQAKRNQVMRRFSTAKLQILVATDIAARGLDIEGITHIFNYDVPHDPESYIHRIGRTGRAGDKGMAITFVTPGEHNYMRLIEQGIRSSLEKYKTNGQKVITNAPKVRVEKKPTPLLGQDPRKKPLSHSGLNQRSRHKQTKPTGKISIRRGKKS